jgi:8-oxo-dGTP pyrophosphatase MutT (NUDIX family)
MTSPSLDCVIQEGNKAVKYMRHINTAWSSIWQFRIAGIDEALGYMWHKTIKTMNWDGSDFHFDNENQIITLTLKPGKGETRGKACQRAFSDLCLKNRGELNNCFDRWLDKPAHRRDFHPIHNTHADWQDLTMPVPARGVFGIVTIGVHLTMYSTRKVDGHEVVDRIWVSQRARGDNVTYSGMLDQVVAGGMDPMDFIDEYLSPGETLRREAMEEAGLFLDLATKIMYSMTDSGRRKPIGKVEKAPAITFYDCKGQDAGRTSEGHLEPGVRFVYDLKLDDSTFQPQSYESGSERFMALPIDEVKQTLHEKRWKPNCGLVMLDFLQRKGLIAKADEENYVSIEKDLHSPLPFKFSLDRYPFLAPW